MNIVELIQALIANIFSLQINANNFKYLFANRNRTKDNYIQADKHVFCEKDTFMEWRWVFVNCNGGNILEYEQ